MDFPSPRPSRAPTGVPAPARTSPVGAVSAVWVMDVNTTPSALQASRDFVQVDISGVVPAQGTTWGRVKGLFR